SVDDSREEIMMAMLAAGAGRADRIAEMRLREQLSELARSGRHSGFSELASTIAHEINQPLGAIVANTEALELLLQSPAPDLTELKEVVANIRSDSLRAADVIRDLRNFLNRTKIELKEVDLVEPVRDTIHFLSALAVNADISSSLALIPLPV